MSPQLAGRHPKLMETSVTRTDFVSDFLNDTAATMARFAADDEARTVLSAMANLTINAMRAGHKILIAGNGGSAGDAQHIAGEFISRLMYDRPPLPAVALTTDTSAITATGNDYGYEYIFERQVQGIGRPGDVFLGISTSGRSKNVLRALEAARAGGLVTFGFCGAEPGPMGALCDLVLRAPSKSTPLIQQVHITAAHVFCALVERGMFPPAD
jgi:D-sedoheptulose 7-phosphate isomerase